MWTMIFNLRLSFFNALTMFFAHFIYVSISLPLHASTCAPTNYCYAVDESIPMTQSDANLQTAAFISLASSLASTSPPSLLSAISFSSDSQTLSSLTSNITQLADALRTYSPRAGMPSFANALYSCMSLLDEQATKHHVQDSTVLLVTGGKGQFQWDKMDDQVRPAVAELRRRGVKLATVVVGARTEDIKMMKFKSRKILNATDTSFESLSETLNEITKFSRMCSPTKTAPSVKLSLFSGKIGGKVGGFKLLSPLTTLRLLTRRFSTSSHRGKMGFTPLKDIVPFPSMAVFLTPARTPVTRPLDDKINLSPKMDMAPFPSFISSYSKEAQPSALLTKISRQSKDGLIGDLVKRGDLRPPKSAVFILQKDVTPFPSLTVIPSPTRTPSTNPFHGIFALPPMKLPLITSLPSLQLKPSTFPAKSPISIPSFDVFRSLVSRKRSP